MPTIYQLGHEPIKDHVFFPDHKTLVVTKDNTVELYKVENANSTPQLVDVLRGHDKTVTSVDISSRRKTDPYVFPRQKCLGLGEKIGRIQAYVGIVENQPSSYRL